MVYSTLNVGRPEKQKQPRFQLETKGREKIMSQLKQAGRVVSDPWEGQPFCSVQAFDWIRPTHIRRALSFTAY